MYFDYAGGSIGADVRLYSINEVRSFHRAVRQQKDIRKAELIKELKR